MGALGCSISGSGPSIFALTKGKDDANKINTEINKIYKETNIDFFDLCIQNQFRRNKNY